MLYILNYVSDKILLIEYCKICLGQAYVKKVELIEVLKNNGTNPNPKT